MSQLWAIIRKNGSYVLRYTSGPKVLPQDSGHRAECRGRAVWAMEREPDQSLGEGVAYATGAIDFSVGRIAEQVIAEIKASAARKINAVAPLWRQINDLHDFATPEIIARRERIDEIRMWSNAMEARLGAITQASELRTFMAEIRA